MNVELVYSTNMRKNLRDLFLKLEVLKVSNGSYYNLIDFFNILNQLGKVDIYVDEYILTPFYICNNKVLELYDYELNIRLVESPSFNTFVLRATGKANFTDVDPEIIRKFENRYLETILPNKSLPVSKLLEFIRYVRKSNEIEKRVCDCFHEFHDSKLYFEVY